eukprot:3836051-Pyramimonas_sp.AAC.1
MQVCKYASARERARLCRVEMLLFDKLGILELSPQLCSRQLPHLLQLVIAAPEHRTTASREPLEHLGLLEEDYYCGSNKLRQINKLRR